MHFQHADDFDWTAARADDWRAPWPGYTMTRYGQKAMREGRKATYLIFKRRARN
jgi:tRNA (guanine-N7-)-methyltransferase